MQTQPLFLISSLMRGMAHRLLTPLSVISNDLNYLKTQLPPGECERSLARCREIAQALKTAAALGIGSDRRERLPAVEFIGRVLAAQGIRLEGGSGAPAFLSADPELLTTAFRLLAETMTALSAGAAPRAKVEPAAGQLLFNFEIPSAGGGAPAEYASLTELFRRALDSDHYAPVFVDAILMALGGSLRAGLSDRLMVEVRLPLCQ